MVKKKTAKKVPRASKKVARADAKPRTPAKRAAAKAFEAIGKAAKKSEKSATNGATRTAAVDEMRGVHQVENLRAELKTKPKSVGRDAGLKVVSWILGDTTFGLSELASVVCAKPPAVSVGTFGPDAIVGMPHEEPTEITSESAEEVDPFS
jgi:hypothetical protein